MSRKNGLFRLRTFALLVVVLALGTGIGAPLASVQAASTTNTVSTTAVNKTDYSVSGEHVIWMQSDGHVKQIHYRNEATKQERILTTSPTAKDAPYIKGSIVVWADKGSQDPSSLNWDIYSYNLDTQVQTKLNKQSGEYSNPTVDGGGVVWYERTRYGRMIYHDLATGRELSLGEGKFPVLNNGIVVYMNGRDGGMSMLTLSTGIRRPLITLGGSVYADWFVTNGSHVLVKIQNGMNASMMAMVSTAKRGEPLVELSPMSAKSQEYAFMSIGNTQAAYVEQVNGSPVTKLVSLQSGTVSALTGADANRKYIGFSGDQLLYETADGTLAYLGGGSSVTVPSMPAIPTTPVTDGDKVKLTASGGTLTASNGKGSLEVPAGALAGEADVSLTQISLEGRATFDEKKRVLKHQDNAWQVQTSLAFQKPVKLTLSYEQTAEWQNKREKLGIYKLNADQQTWSYVGGVTVTEAGKIHTELLEAGVYAVMLRDISFPDLAGHWSQQAVEVLAARGIVDGLGSGKFGPSDRLTRAQFTKMIASAMGLTPIYPAQPTFTDVSRDHWSYGWIEAAAAKGIVQGSGNRFLPNDSLTREQMMVMLIRAAGDRLNYSEQGNVESVLTRFQDHGAVSAWAKQHVEQALRLQLIEGNGNQLQPLHTSSRAQAATVIYRVLGKLNQL